MKKVYKVFFRDLITPEKSGYLLLTAKSITKVIDKFYRRHEPYTFYLVIDVEEL